MPLQNIIVFALIRPFFFHLRGIIFLCFFDSYTMGIIIPKTLPQSVVTWHNYSSSMSQSIKYIHDIVVSKNSLCTFFLMISTFLLAWHIMTVILFCTTVGTIPTSVNMGCHENETHFSSWSPNKGERNMHFFK